MMEDMFVMKKEYNSFENEYKIKSNDKYNYNHFPDIIDMEVKPLDLENFKTKVVLEDMQNYINLQNMKLTNPQLEQEPEKNELEDHYAYEFI